MPYIKIEMDDKEVRDELTRLIKGPTARTFGEFERIFAEAFSVVYEDVHIETGSLFSTGKVDTFMEDPYSWEGTIRYGGPAPGMLRDPVYYGIYELARGGSHFFFRGAHEIVPHDMVSTILEFYADGKKAI